MAALTAPSTPPRHPDPVSEEVVEIVDFGSCVLFTNDAEVLEAERHRIYSPEELSDDLGPVFIDEGVEQRRAPLQRPMTAVQRSSSR